MRKRCAVRYQLLAGAHEGFLLAGLTVVLTVLLHVEKVVVVGRVILPIIVPVTSVVDLSSSATACRWSAGLWFPRLHPPSSSATRTRRCEAAHAKLGREWDVRGDRHCCGPTTAHCHRCCYCLRRGSKKTRTDTRLRKALASCLGAMTQPAQQYTKKKKKRKKRKVLVRWR